VSHRRPTPSQAASVGGLLSYIEVDEIDKRVAAAKQAGAQMIRGPFDVEGVGRVAIFKDVVGALIAWMTPLAR
jgi:predicted enzyme related to lactoylglutathione lyase